MELRPYQIDAINSIYNTIRQGKNPLCYMATGSGKTFIFTKIVKDAKSKGRKILVVVNKLILIDNTIKEFKKLGLTSTIYCGYEKEISDITVGTIQSLKKIKDGEFNVVIFDEGHRFDLDNKTMKSFLSKFTKTIFLTFTATPFRDNEYIFGDDKFWSLAYEKNLKSLTEEKYLVPISYQGQKKESIIDISHVKKNKEDYILSELQNEIMNHQDKIQMMVTDALEKSKDRKKIVVITTGIEHADFVLSLLDDSATIIHSELKDEEREKNLSDFQAGRKRILVSVLIVSEGYDDPEIDCIWFFRPTRSITLYIQAAGRGLRIAPDKLDCLFLDYGQVVENLGDIYRIKVGKKKKKDKKPYTLVCPVCDRIFTSPKKQCDCGHIFTRECLYCGETLPLTDKCHCENRLDGHVKNLTIESYTDNPLLRIDNPIMKFCMHQGPKQEVFLIKIQQGIFARPHHWYIPRFKMEKIESKMTGIITPDITIQKVEELFREYINYIVLERDGKYYKPMLIGLKNNSTFIVK